MVLIKNQVTNKQTGEKKMKQLIKTVPNKHYVPILEGNITVINNNAYASDLDSFAMQPTNQSIADGVYNAKEFSKGIYNPIANLTIDMFPTHTIENFKPLQRRTMEAQDLLKALATVEHCQSNEGSRYYLNGVFFDITNHSLVATDGHRLARYKLPAIAKLFTMDIPRNNGKAGFILSRDTVKILLADMKVKGDVTVEINKDYAKFYFHEQELTILLKLIDGTFPEYERVIPNVNTVKEHLTIEIADIKDYQKAYKLAYSVRTIKHFAAFKDGFMYDNDKYIPHNVTGLSDGFGFDAKYLSEMCKVMPDNNVTLLQEDGRSPAVYESDNLTYVVMPMRA